MRRATILIATAEDGQQRLRRVLAGCEVALAATCEEASAQLAQRDFELVILGSHFAESSLFDVLLRLPREQRGRVVCVQAVPFSHGLGRRTFEAFRSACLALGAGLVLDLTRFPEDAEGDARLRELLRPELTI